MRKDRNERSGRQRVGKSTFRAKPVREDRDRFLKIIGTILVSTMIVALLGSIWFGWKIRAGLTELDHEKVAGQELKEKSLLLETRRTELMAREMIEKKASVLGLRKPGQKQTIRP